MKLIKKIKELTDTDDGYRRFQGLMLVPKELEQELIARYHDDIREGHPGEARTVEKIQRNYYFPGTIRKVRKFIKVCNKCQQNKPVHRVIPMRPWHTLRLNLWINRTRKASPARKL
jgi:Integrase zinc binding domain